MAKKKTDSKVEKAESVAPLPVGSLLSTERGQPRIATSSFFVQDQKKRELAMPTRLCTFDAMMEDDSVYTSVYITNLHVINSLYNGKFVAKTSKGQVAADFLNYNIRNMRYGTWYDVCSNAATDLQYGFSLLNIVAKKRNYGKYAGARCLDKISPRDQKSVYGWLWDKDFREVQGFVQKPPLKQTRKWDMRDWNNGISALSTGKYYNYTYPIIRSNQLLWFRYDPKNGNPQGDSPLAHCYLAWKEKELIQRYEVVGVSKDLGGAVVLRVPSDLLERAQDPTNFSADAASLQALQNNAKALHAGESSFILLSSDVDETTKTPLYDFKLQGIDGGGKQYSTEEIIKRKNNSIYNTFGTGYLLLGQDSLGSYNLATTAKSTHSHYVSKNIMEKKVVIDTQLIPRLLKINDIDLDWEDMPEFEPAEPTEFDPEVMSKFIQRTKSVGALTPDALRFIYEKSGLPTEGIEDLIFDDGDTSRGGESEGSSGVGNTQQAGLGTQQNLENKSLIKNFIQEGDYIVDINTGEEHDFEKERS